MTLERMGSNGVGWVVNICWLVDWCFRYGDYGIAWDRVEGICFVEKIWRGDERGGRGREDYHHRK